MIPALQHEPRCRSAWRGLLLVLLVVVGWFAFGPPPPTPDLDGGDKINHVLAFVALATAAALGSAPGWRSAAIAAVGLLAYGGFIEIVQTQLTHREGEWADLAADALGLAAGLLIAAALRRASASARTGS